MVRDNLVVCISVTVALLATATGSADAGFILDTIAVELPDGAGPPENAGPPADLAPPGWARIPDWTKEMLQARLRLTMGTDFGGHGPLTLLVTGETNEDPEMSTGVTFTNASGVTWSGFDITLPDGGEYEFVAGTASSDRMTLVSESPYELVFGLPEAIPDGEKVSFEYTVLVPSTGFFVLPTTFEPTPEPATLAFVGIGVIGLAVARRRHRAAC